MDRDVPTGHESMWWYGEVDEITVRNNMPTARVNLWKANESDETGQGWIGLEGMDPDVRAGLEAHEDFFVETTIPPIPGRMLFGAFEFIGSDTQTDAA